MQRQQKTDKEYKILRGRICPYCGQAPKLVDSAQVYNGKSYGLIWLCGPCDAYVGVHKNDFNHKPLGRLADAELRRAKMLAHSYFDSLWRAKMRHGVSKSKARHAAYAWLADKMGLEVRYTHIGMFDVAQCYEVVRICAEILPW